MQGAAQREKKKSIKSKENKNEKEEGIRAVSSFCMPAWKAEQLSCWRFYAAFLQQNHRIGFIQWIGYCSGQPKV